ncbi:MAG: myo-inositol-1(or 4)-monophosphatase [Paracoccaceae bacterium]|jgi:myo-inositol-1(or 4)-monophosphatase
MRRNGAAALDLAWVAAGRLDGYWERGVKPWDVAAGVLLVREAGGFVQDLRDEEGDPVASGNLIAANSEIFDRFAKVIRG